MWLGPRKTTGGVSPTYWLPWRVRIALVLLDGFPSRLTLSPFSLPSIQNHVPMKEKHDQIMEWLDMPFEERPQLILG